MQLKKYQSRTLKILSDFLNYAKLLGNEKAFEKYQDAQGYNSNYQSLIHLEDVPYICLRLPTGGGKTLIGSYAIQLAAENFIERDFPFVLWLVPSNEIRRQTLAVLKNPDNFYSQILYKTFKGKVQIFDVADFRRLRPQDLTQRLNICVATFQSFKVEDKEGRKVYQADEELGACFKNIPCQSYFSFDEKGRYTSFANLISYLRPLMIVDEAHNYSTDLSFDVTKNLRPSVVIELTATPANNSNVLVKISAEELYKEEMIKLPIEIGEVSNSPDKTIDYAVQKRAMLENIAVTESEYVRPIALYQAENINRECNVDFVKNYLIEEAKIPETEIAIATGERHELSGINLFSRECTIRHIITVQALKEGWDCPFASVFCSLSNTHSARDAEQLLGRVLRMPYAKRRRSLELNKAYAFFRVNSWTEAVSKIKDDLFGMGFNEREVNFALNPQGKLFNPRTTIEVVTSETPRIDSLNMILQSQITVKKVEDGYSVIFENITDDDIKELTESKNKIFRKPDDREIFLRAVYQGNIRTTKEKSPAERGVKFLIPQLCLDFGNGAHLAKREDFFPEDGWSLTETRDYSLPLSHSESDIQFYEITLHGNKLIEKLLFNDGQNLFEGQTNWTTPDLIGWLSEKIKDTFIEPEDFAEFTRRVLNQLINGKNFSLDELIRMRFTIRKLLEDKITLLKDKDYEKNWRTILFGCESPRVRVEKDISFTFNQLIYPAKKLYMGSVQFSKHFYSTIGYMNPEEVRCAQYIDANSKVETWIRNIESEAEYSFWLPTHKYKFYPDFVVKLKDGTFAAIEYKGEGYKTNDDSKEKNLVGEIWADKSDGICKFLMAVKRDETGSDLSTQINEFFS